MIPRPYQTDLVRRAVSALSEYGNTLAIAPTGSGKTLMISWLLNELQGRQMILQHREELVDQNRKKFHMINPGRTSSIAGLGTKDYSGDTIFGMAQTLGRNGNMADMPALNVLVVDEAHHTRADSYQRIINAARDKNPDCLIAGFTATGSRGDKKGLKPTFDNVCDLITMQKLIDLGFLVPVRTFIATLPGLAEEIRNVKKTAGGEFDLNQVETLMDTKPVNEAVFREWKEYAGDRKTIIFASTIKHAQDVCYLFQSNGIKADCVFGDTPNRAEILKRFEFGDTQVICNVSVLTEGYDCLDMETEVLTPTGWRGFGSINKGEEVYGFNLDNNNIEKCIVDNTNSREIRPNEKMVEIKSQHMNIRVTEGHNIYVIKNRRGAFKKVKAGLLTDWSSEYAIPVSGKHDFPGVTLTDDEIKIIAWFITDGHLTKAGKLEIYQSENKHLNHILQLISRLGYKHWNAIKISKSNYGETAPVHRIGIGKKQLYPIAEYLDKAIHPYLMNMSKRQFKLFWEELLLGDGSIQHGKSGWLWTGRKELVNNIMQMAILREYHTSYKSQLTNTGGTAYRVTIREKNKISSRPNDPRSATILKTTPELKERVWCLSNRLGTIITRRMGKVAIVGNCPPVSCVVLLRPCSFKSTMLQMIGRGLRTVDPEIHPGIIKRDCIVLDFGESLRIHGDLNQGVRFDDAEAQEGEKKECPNCKTMIPVQTRECPACGYEFPVFQSGKEKDAADVVMMEVDLLKRSPFKWADIFGAGKVLVASGFSAWAVTASANGTDWITLGKKRSEGIRRLAVGAKLQSLAAGDDFMRMNEDTEAATKSKRWLRDQPSFKQLELLRRAGYNAKTDFNLRKYEASCLLNFLWAKNDIEVEVFRYASN